MPDFSDPEKITFRSFKDRHRTPATTKWFSHPRLDTGATRMGTRGQDLATDLEQDLSIINQRINNSP